MFGLFLTLILMVRKVRGAILIGILPTTVLAVIVEAVANLGAFNAEKNKTGLVPDRAAPKRLTFRPAFLRNPR